MPLQSPRAAIARSDNDDDNNNSNNNNALLTCRSKEQNQANFFSVLLLTSSLSSSSSSSFFYYKIAGFTSLGRPSAMQSATSRAAALAPFTPVLVSSPLPQEAVTRAVCLQTGSGSIGNLWAVARAAGSCCSTSRPVMFVPRGRVCQEAD